MPFLHEKKITRALVRRHPHVLFVFGDNYEGRGYGGQAAAMRGEPNAVGIPTKVRPTMEEGAFLTDEHLDGWNARVAGPFKRLQRHLMDNGIVVWPADGIGSGLAQLETRAPLIWDDLQEWKQFLEDVDDGLFRARADEGFLSDSPHNDLVFDLNRPPFDVAEAMRREVAQTLRLPERVAHPDLAPARVSEEVRRSIEGYLNTLRQRGEIYPDIRVNPDGSVTFTLAEPMQHIRLQSSRFGSFVDEYLREIGDGETRDG